MTRPAMTLFFALLSVAVIFDFAPASAQTRDPELDNYRLVSDLNHGMVMWVNPAGLGMTPRRSTLMGHVTWERPEDGDWGLAQYMVGFQARIVGFGYHHDEFSGRGFSQGDAYTLAAGLGRANTSFGVSRTWYTVGETEGSWVLGAGLTSQTAVVGVVWRDIGSPQVRDSVRAERLIAAVTVRPSASPLTVSGEIDYLLEGSDLRVFRIGGGWTFMEKLRAQALIGWDGDGDFQGFVISAQLRLDEATAVGAARLDAGGDAGSGSLGVEFSRQAEQ